MRAFCNTRSDFHMEKTKETILFAAHLFLITYHGNGTDQFNVSYFLSTLYKYSSRSNGFGFVISFLWQICSNPTVMPTFPHDILHADTLIASKYKKHYSFNQAMFFLDQ